MTNLEKMNELVNSDATKKQVIEWAYMNRIWLADLPEEKGFFEMQKSVDSFLKSEKTLRGEHEMWEDFLDAQFIPRDKNKFPFIAYAQAWDLEDSKA
jgi:hypothetical protein